MSTIPVSEFRASFAHIVNTVAYGQERVVVQRNGKELVAVVPISMMKPC